MKLEINGLFKLKIKIVIKSYLDIELFQRKILVVFMNLILGHFLVVSKNMMRQRLRRVFVRLKKKPI